MDNKMLGIEAYVTEGDIASLRAEGGVYLGCDSLSFQICARSCQCGSDTALSGEYNILRNRSCLRRHAVVRLIQGYNIDWVCRC